MNSCCVTSPSEKRVRKLLLIAPWHLTKLVICAVNVLSGFAPCSVNAFSTVLCLSPVDCFHCFYLQIMLRALPTRIVARGSREGMGMPMTMSAINRMLIPAKTEKS